MALEYVILKNIARVELYINAGTGSGERSKELFDALQARKDAIEKKFGATLQWDRLDGARARRIAAPLDGGGIQDEERWPKIQDAMIDAMIRLEKAMRPWLDKL